MHPVHSNSIQPNGGSIGVKTDPMVPALRLNAHLVVQCAEAEAGTVHAIAMYPIMYPHVSHLVSP